MPKKGRPDLSAFSFFRLLRTRGLDIVDLAVYSVRGDKLVMRAALGYAPLVEHEYLTGLGKGGYSVGYQDDAGRAEAPFKLGAYLRVVSVSTAERESSNIIMG